MRRKMESKVDKLTSRLRPREDRRKTRDEHAAALTALGKLEADLEDAGGEDELKLRGRSSWVSGASSVSSSRRMRR